MAKGSRAALTGLILAVAGAVLFARAPGGTDFVTVGPFLLMVAGIIVLLVGLYLINNAQMSAIYAGLVEPGSGWELIGPNTFRRTAPGGEARVRLIPAQYNRGEQVTPPQTELVIPVENREQAVLELRGSASFLQTDVRDLFSGLKNLDSVQISGMHALGHPPEQASRIVSRWLSQGFEAWRSGSADRLKLVLTRGRLAGSNLEFTFDGKLGDQGFDDNRSIRSVVEEFVRAPLSWR